MALDANAGIIAKTTIPPGFGLVPELRSHKIAVARPDENPPSMRQAIEFVHATPLEYLARWQSSNIVFGDDVHLVAVIRWNGGAVSFAISQPQYHGTPAEHRQIAEYFEKAGWTRLNDPSGHAVFYNFAFDVIAIDAEKRNCYINEAGLQPFDVILCKPDHQMERYLRIYPDA